MRVRAVLLAATLGPGLTALGTKGAPASRQ